MKSNPVKREHFCDEIYISYLSGPKGVRFIYFVTTQVSLDTHQERGDRA